jgi:hypothetical protein
MITTNCRGCGQIADCNADELCDYCATDPDMGGHDEGCPECGAGGGGDPYGECTCDE